MHKCTDSPSTPDRLISTNIHLVLKMSSIPGIDDMKKLQHKTLATKPFDLTYSYYLSPDFNSKLDPSVPTLVLLHGYPDDAYMWAGAVPCLLKLPYPFVLVEILGLGDTDKPAEAEKYNYRPQANSIAQILDHEKVPNNVVPIGHDWGSGKPKNPSIYTVTPKLTTPTATAQRFYLYHRTRCIGLSILSLAYQIPSPEKFDLDAENALTTKSFGYPQWEYWNFFCSPDAPDLMNADLSRMYEVNHGTYPSPEPSENGRDIWMREMFCKPGAMREYVAREGKWKNSSVELKPYAQKPELKKRFVERMEKGGFEGPVQYYHSLARNTMLEDERELCKKEDKSDRRITVPMLYIGQTGDWVCRTDQMGAAKEQRLVGDLEEKVVDAGHWVLYEKPEEIAGLISDWLKRKFPVEK
jgi:soluble epoxide hydrolase/lipid-phosphate phosphatase